MDDDKDNDATDPKLISSYMRSEALDDGVLVDVTEMAREAGFVIPVVLNECSASYAPPRPGSGGSSRRSTVTIRAGKPTR